MGTVVNIPIPKAGANVTLAVDLDEVMELPADSLREILFQGLKNVLNRGQSKETSAKGMEAAQAEQAKEKILIIVDKQWQLCKEGKVRASGGKAKRTSNSEYETEARRDAKLQLKAAMRRAGLKVSHYTAKQITEGAEELLAGEHGPAIRERAKATVDARNAQKAQADIDVSTMKADPKLVEKAEAKSKSRKKGTAADLGAVVAATKGQVGLSGKGQGGFGARH